MNIFISYLSIIYPCVGGGEAARGEAARDYIVAVRWGAESVVFVSMADEGGGAL